MTSLQKLLLEGFRNPKTGGPLQLNYFQKVFLKGTGGEARGSLYATHRRAGATWATAIRAALAALEGLDVLVVACDAKHTKALLALVAEFLKASDYAEAIQHLGDHLLRLDTGGSVRTHLNARGRVDLLGCSVNVVLVDTANYLPDEVWDLMIAVAQGDRYRKTRTQAVGNGCIEENTFRSLYESAQGKSFWEVYRLPVTENPEFPVDHQTRLQEQLSQKAWETQYLARFVGLVNNEKS